MKTQMTKRAARAEIAHQQRRLETIARTPSRTDYGAEGDSDLIDECRATIARLTEALPTLPE